MFNGSHICISHISSLISVKFDTKDFHLLSLTDYVFRQKKKTGASLKVLKISTQTDMNVSGKLY